MNGFTLMADSYRRLVEQGKVSIEDVKRDIEIYQIIGRILPPQQVAR